MCTKYYVSLSATDHCWRCWIVPDPVWILGDGLHAVTFCVQGPGNWLKFPGSFLLDVRKNEKKNVYICMYQLRPAAAIVIFAHLMPYLARLHALKTWCPSTIKVLRKTRLDMNKNAIIIWTCKVIAKRLAVYALSITKTSDRLHCLIVKSIKTTSLCKVKLLVRRYCFAWFWYHSSMLEVAPRILLKRVAIAIPDTFILV